MQERPPAHVGPDQRLTGRPPGSKDSQQGRISYTCIIYLWAEMCAREFGLTGSLVVHARGQPAAPSDWHVRYELTTTATARALWALGPAAPTEQKSVHDQNLRGLARTSVRLPPCGKWCYSNAITQPIPCPTVPEACTTIHIFGTGCAYLMKQANQYSQQIGGSLVPCAAGRSAYLAAFNTTEFFVW